MMGIALARDSVVIPVTFARSAWFGRPRSCMRTPRTTGIWYHDLSTQTSETMHRQRPICHAHSGRAQGRSNFLDYLAPLRKRWHIGPLSPTRALSAAGRSKNARDSV